MKKLLLFLTAITLFSCSSNDDAPVVAPVETIAFIKGNFNATPVDFSMTSYLVSPYYFGFNNGFQGDGFTKTFYYGCSLRPAGNAGTDNDLSIGFENMYTTNDDATEDAAFYGLFSPAPTNYISSAQDNLRQKGISVAYSTPTDYYSTLYGSQAGSSMSITSSTSGIEAGGSAKVQNLTGTFNCKLYNADQSDMITVTGGQFKIIVKEYE